VRQQWRQANARNRLERLSTCARLFREALAAFAGDECNRIGNRYRIAEEMEPRFTPMTRIERK
jgi:hypothetical protein